MPQLRTRSASRRAWRKRALLFVVYLLAINAVFGENGLTGQLRAHHEFRMASQSLIDLKHENARLREAARQLREDAGAIDAIARRELGLIRPGEILVFVKTAR